MSPRDVCLNLLRKWEGRGEVGGNNTGWWVSYLTRGNDGPWCAALLYTAIETAYFAFGLDCPVQRTYSARKLAAAGKSIPKAQLEPGDIVCFPRGEPWQGHVAMVAECAPTPGVYVLVDGNVGRNAKVRFYTEDLRQRDIVGCCRVWE